MNTESIISSVKSAAMSDLFGRLQQRYFGRQYPSLMTDSVPKLDKNSYSSIIVKGYPSGKEYELFGYQFMGRRIPNPSKHPEDVMRVLKLIGSHDRSFKVLAVRV